MYGETYEERAHVSENLVRKCNVRIAELEDALKMLMEWQAQHVDKWHNSAYDNASAVLKKGCELTPNDKLRGATDELK